MHIMKRTYKRFFYFFANLSLKKKLVSIAAISILLLSLSGFAGSYIISHAHLKLLEEAVANNLSYSASIISNNLNNIEDMTSSLLADSVIQSNLITANESSNPREQAAAHQALSYALQDYYGQYKASYVDYLTLYHSKNTIYSNFLSNQRTPEHIETALLELADEQEGRPVWQFQYAETNGFYLSRQIRNIQSPYFDSLGTIIVSVNLDKMIHSLNMQEGAFPDTQYFIAYDNHIIYHADDTTNSIFQQMGAHPNNSYAIISVGSHKYFVYSTQIPEHELVYTCYLSYDSIFHSASLAQVISICMILLTCLIAIALFHYMIVTISRQTNYLVEKMQAYNADNVPAVKTNSLYENCKDEFGLLNRQFNSMAERIQNLIQVNYVHALWKKDAQLKALEKQIQPHFLYNTLESINWRAKAAGNLDISNMVESLGNLLRASLSGENDVWTLEKELAITESYITIQKYRFEEHLDYYSQCDPALKPTQLPKFMIQPLVENAVHYGLEENMDTCRIEVIVALEHSDSTLHITVRNNGSQFEDDLLNKLRSSQVATGGFGIGLINIDERLKLMFGSSYGLTLYNEQEYAVAQITIPYPNTKNKEESEKNAETDYRR